MEVGTVNVTFVGRAVRRTPCHLTAPTPTNHDAERFVAEHLAHGDPVFIGEMTVLGDVTEVEISITAK